MPVPVRRLASPLRLLVPIAVLCIASTPPSDLGAQTLPEGTSAALHWRLLGPFRGGRVLAVAGIPGDPRTFYFGSVDGGVWRTANAGVTWSPLFDDQPVASVGALALAPSDPRIIYVGTGEADMRSDISSGNGVYRSTDGGAHWRHVGLDDTRHIGRIVVDARNPDIVLVAALGHAYGPSSERGVFRSVDGGRSWQRVLYRDENTGAIDLSLDPTDPQLIYAALWQTRRPPWSQYAPDQGPGSGLYRSADGGRTWAPLSGHGLPGGPLGRIGVAAAGQGRVYALIDAQVGGGLYRSENRGSTWRLVGRDPRITRGWYFGQVFVDPTNAGAVYVPNVALLRSTDSGATFTAIKGEPGGDDYHALWIDPRAPGRLIVGSDQGAVISLDSGRTWSSWYNQPTAQFYHVSTDFQFPYWVYGAQQDAGTAAIKSRSDYGLLTFRDWHPVGAGESGYIAPDPLDSNIVYGGDIYGGAFRFDQTTGQSQVISPWPLSAFGRPMPARKYRATWTSPLVFDRVDPHVLYFGAQLLLATRDGGLHWDALSPDLTGVQGGAPDSSPLSVANAAGRGYGVIYTIAPSPLARGVIWVGTDDGLIQLTRDGGRTWENVTPPGLAPWSKVTLIEASPFDSGAAYAAIDRHRLDDVAPYVYRTTDWGRHWTLIVHGLAPDAYVHAVRADPARRGLLYAGTETGVSLSFDDGASWQSLQLNLPPVSVRDLAVKDGDLVAGTHGRAFWILDDLAPLEALPEGPAGAEPRLFAPRPAVRLRRSVNQDTPLPPEEPHGENPPAGAVIDYYLPATTGPVTLEISDAQGTLVRRFTSEEHAAAPRTPPQFTNEWLPRPQPLTTRRGLNRFVWDLRYTPPPVDEPEYGIAAIAGLGTVTEPEGPLALPGEYRATLSVAAARLVQPLTIRLDPRVHVSKEALAAQLGLALEVGHALADEYAIHNRVRALHAQLDSVSSPRLDEATRRSLGALRTASDTLTADLLQVGTGLGEIETAVERADRDPTAQMREAFEGLRQRLERVGQRWQDLNATDIPALNAALSRRGVRPIAPGP